MVKIYSRRFFIIGAPKCGTTSLAKWLSEHPNVFVSPIKEPHYFSTDLANRTVRSRKQYDSLFAKVRDTHYAIGEASTWYLYSKEAVPAIEREFPDARYIVMTRDPVQMAHSLYHHNVRVLHEDQPTFEKAWRLQEERARGKSIPKTCVEPAFLQYQKVCALGTLVEKLLDMVPADRVLHIPLESVQKNPQTEYAQVLKFLGVPDDGKSEFPVENVARGYRSKLLQRIIRFGGRVKSILGVKRRFGVGRLNDRSLPKAALSDDFKLILDSEFSEERNLISRLKI